MPNKLVDAQALDLISMVRRNVIGLASLEQFFQEVLPQLEDYSLRTNRGDFERKFALFKQRLAESLEQS